MLILNRQREYCVHKPRNIPALRLLNFKNCDKILKRKKINYLPTSDIKNLSFDSNANRTNFFNIRDKKLF